MTFALGRVIPFVLKRKMNTIKGRSFKAAAPDLVRGAPWEYTVWLKLMSPSGRIRKLSRSSICYKMGVLIR